MLILKNGEDSIQVFTMYFGSVVTKDIPSGVIAAGNPCKVIRKITEKDKVGFTKKK